MGDGNGLLNKAAGILRSRTALLNQDKIDELVRAVLAKREAYLNTVREHGSPLYLIEPEIIKARAREFVETFRKYIPRTEPFYALKSNNHPVMIETLTSSGFGIDVSSGWELDQALKHGAAKMIFSGPGKTDRELTKAVANHDKLIILMDSPGELERLAKITSESKTRIKAGIRVTTNEEGLWRKFGVPLRDLPKIFAAVEKLEFIDLCGIQFHTSWNLGPDAQCRFIEKLGDAIGTLSPARRARVEFIDIGGGYWPPQGEWVLPLGTPEGKLRQTILDRIETPLSHYYYPARPLEEFARAIGETLKKHIFALTGEIRVFAEPGRWISNDSMHIALTVIDRKHKDMVVTDGGNNIIGWERFETDYAPVINLSRPDTNERQCYIFGSLCTPHDIWGYSYHGKDIQPGDILMIPNQGAYTWSLRQRFIKPLPEAVVHRQQSLESSVST